jgi:hypothetical protein
VTGPVESPLAAQRRLLLEQMGTQRVRIAHQIAAAGGAHGGFPRSVTVRWLMQEPELVTKLVGRVAGGRIASAVPATLLLIRFLRSAAIL